MTEKWIKYSEQKPPKNTWVLGAVEGYDSCDICWYNEKEEFILRQSKGKPERMTHWREIPQLPWGSGTYWKLDHD